MIRTALYIRVSTEEQAMHGLSLEAQDAALTDYAKKNDLTIVGRYIDEGITARKKMTNRKELLRLLEDVKAGRIDLIIFTKIDRWFRNIYDYHKVQEILEKHNVNWKTIYESYETSSAAGRLHINIMLSVAQDEADRTSERIKAVFANKVKNKEYPSGETPFGLLVKDSKLYIDEENRHIVDAIFKRFSETHSITGTQKYISNKYGKTFDSKSFTKMFKNTLYCGEYRGITEFCEPYITREQFDRNQEIISNKNVKQTPSGITYIFSGLLICPECGRRMSGLYGIRADGNIAMYRCPGYIKIRDCGHKLSIMEKTIEEYLFQNVLKELDKYKADYDFKVSEKKKQKSTGTSEKAIEKIKKKLSKLKDLYINDMIDIDEYKRDYDDLNRQLAIMEEETKEDTSPIDIEAIKILLSKSTEEIYQTMTAENRRNFWRGFIDHIVVHDRDNMEIFFR